MKIKKRMIKKLTFISGLMLIINMSFSGVFFIAQLASANGIGSMDNECQDFGFDFGVAKWEYDDGHWIFGIANNGTSVTGTDMEALWDVGESDATGIIIKAGSTVYERIDGTSGTVNQANPNLSHITFCGDNKETPYCGDGQISGDEQCDNDQANGQVCVPEYGTSCAYCTAGCDEITLEGPKCGDGIANGNEQCDDGNTNNGDGCSAACEIEETLFCQLTLTKSDAGYDPVQPGAEMVYHLTLTNTGTADCTGGGVLLKDVFDAVTSYISAVPEPMNVNEDENYIKWNFGTIKPDEMKNIDLTMKVSADAAYGSTLLNRAVYWSDQTGWGQEVNETTAVYCPQPDLGSICGYKFNDLNKNSQRDNEEPGLPDWTIGLGYTMGDAAVYISTSTDANGYYCFTSLLPKEYTIAEQLKNGWTNSTPLYQSIILGEGDNTTVNFGNYIPDIEPVYGGISGYKFGDSDGLASTTDDQVGLAGWLINLFNSSSTSTPIATTTTNANGYYEFANLTAGEYALSEIMLSGWTQMSAPAAIDLTAGENSPNNNFVNHEYILGSICGYKFNDLNKNSQRDNEEPGLPDWTIGLGYTMGDAAVYISTSTDANGYYCFTSLLPKEYTIAEQLKNGWTNSTPLYQSIILGEGDNTTVNFGNYIPDIEPVYGGISGYKFGDSDGLASTTDDQVGLAGWLINLFNSSSTSTPIATTTTNANGYYGFANLTAGEYALSEVMLSGWTQMSAPAAIDLTAGENSPNNNFVNYYENIIEPICGDGIVNQEIEQCDGTAGIINHYICTQSCRLEYVPYCGDNIKNGAEQCDGTDGLVSGKTCNNQCVLTGGGGGGGAFIITNAHGFLPEVKGEEGKPILSIDKTVNADFANAGDVVEYSIKLINNGNLTAFNVVLSDELPNGFTSAIDNSKILTFSLGDILPGENRTTTYKVKISDNAPAGIYANLARASASNHDPIVDTVNLEVRKVETLGIELPATGFSLKEFLSIVLVIIIALGSITIGKKSYNNL